MVSFPKYKNYKDTSISWIQNIPTTWKIERAKWLFRKMERPVRPEDDVVTAFRDGEVTLRKNRRKAILIDRAVTKGLNPNVPMRDSGVEWIGEIPAHWNFLQFKHCCKIIKDGLHLTPSKHNEGINFVSTQHVRNRKICLEEATYISEKDYRLGHPKVNPEAGDVLITLVGSIGFAALVTINHMPLSFTRHVGYVRCNSNKIVQEYLINYTESYIFTCFIEKNVSQTAQPSIYLGSLASHYLPLPPLEEQVEINQWLSRVIKPYSEMVETAVQHISMLQEMKQIFISQAVTGKLKI